jgi:hypothetical protein
MKMNNTNPEGPTFDFATFLSEFGHGSTNKQASEKLQEIVRACRETGQKGALTIKISIDTSGGGANTLAELRCSLSVKKPEPSLPGSTYYVTDGGALVDEDPRQMKLPGKVLDLPNVRSIPSTPTKEG